MTLVYLSIAFTLGILAGHVLRSDHVLTCSTPGWLFPVLVVALAAPLFFLRAHPRPRLILAIVIFALLGAWRYNGEPFERCWGPHDLAYYQTHEGVWATVEGQVVGYPDVRDRGTRYTIAVESVTIEGSEHAVRGRALIEAPRYPLYSYSDRLRVHGLLLTPPASEDFDYRRYLATHGIHSLVRRPRIERLGSGASLFWQTLHAIRTRGAAIINRILPEPAASLTNGMVLGIEGGIPQRVDDAFSATGTSHLIVISGSNIALLAGVLVAGLGSVLPRRRAALLAAPLILLYVLLVGADPPALRAGAMGVLSVGAIYFGRRKTAYVSLCAAGLMMLALNPLTLWDIGFQLSFMATLGLVLLGQPVGRALFAVLDRWLPTDIVEKAIPLLQATVVVTMAAQATVTPLLLVHFGRLSLISLLANCLVLPVQPLILAGGIVSLLAGALWQPLGQAAAILPWLFLTYTVKVVEAAASIPFASLEFGRVAPGFVAGYYALLVLAVARRRWGWSRR